MESWRINRIFSSSKQKRKAINFNYYLDNELINVKYRDGQKNFKLVSGAKLIFYGLDSIKDSNKVYIVEGEMDALSLHEAEFILFAQYQMEHQKAIRDLNIWTTVLSILKNKTEIILCTDNDEAGLNLRNELARRLGKHRCKYIDFDSYKDAK